MTTLYDMDAALLTKTNTNIHQIPINFHALHETTSNSSGDHFSPMNLFSYYDPEFLSDNITNESHHQIYPPPPPPLTTSLNTDQLLYHNSYQPITEAQYHQQLPMKAHEPTDEHQSEADFYSPPPLALASVQRNKCEQCGKIFTKASCLANHQKIHQYQAGRELATTITDTEIEQLLAASESDLNSEWLPANSPLNHWLHGGDQLRKSSSVATFQCELCYKSFPTKQKLQRHSVVHRRSEAQANRNSPKFHCLQCSKTFTSRQGYAIHQRIHRDERPYGCKYCEKAFRDGGTLRKHERIHTLERPHVCPVCRRGFAQKSALREHLHAVHIPATNGDSYQCAVCSANILLANASEHLIQHSDDLNNQQQQQQQQEFHQQQQQLTYDHENGVFDLPTDNSFHNVPISDQTAADDLFSIIDSLSCADRFFQYCCSFCPLRFGDKQQMELHLANFHCS